MRLRHVGLLAAFGTVAAFAACTLNPQPLPPRDDFNGESASDDGGLAKSDASGFGGGPDVPGTADAGTGTPSADADGGTEAGDGGSDDAGDASDAADAADADGG